MNKTEAAGKTLDAAIESGLKILNLTKDDVDVEVLATGGFLKNFRVRLTKKLSAGQKAQNCLEQIVEKMGFEYSVDLTESKDEIYLNLISLSLSQAESGSLIGHRGEVLDALQLITTLICSGDKKQARLTVDAEGYRARREKALENLARNLESKVCRTGKYARLEPMNPAERRVIHQTLQESEKVETISVGDEPDRCVIIKLKTDKNKTFPASSGGGGERGGRRNGQGGGRGRSGFGSGRGERGERNPRSGGARNERSGESGERSRHYGSSERRPSAQAAAVKPQAAAAVQSEPGGEGEQKSEGLKTHKKLNFVYRSEKKRKR